MKAKKKGANKRKKGGRRLRPSAALKRLAAEIEAERRREIEKHNRTEAAKNNATVEEDAYPERIRKRLLAAAIKRPDCVSMYDVAVMHQRAMMDETPYLGDT